MDNRAIAKWLFLRWLPGSHQAIGCPLIAWRQPSDWISFDCLVASWPLRFLQLLGNCQEIVFWSCICPMFAIGAIYYLFNYCSSNDHLCVLDICYWNDHFVEFNNVLNYIANRSFLFLGIDLCFTCGVNFLEREYGHKDNIIQGGLLSSMDFFLCNWYDGIVDWTIN
jgi:hypothetical protein